MTTQIIEDKACSAWNKAHSSWGQSFKVRQVAEAIQQTIKTSKQKKRGESRMNLGLYLFIGVHHTTPIVTAVQVAKLAAEAAQQAVMGFGLPYCEARSNNRPIGPQVKDAATIVS